MIANLLQLFNSFVAQEVTVDNIEKFIELIEKLIELQNAANQNPPKPE